ncbi:hypothetical protein MBLNU459_g5418t1 [Dothideomycetes sp. NU459]
MNDLNKPALPARANGNGMAVSSAISPPPVLRGRLPTQTLASRDHPSTTGAPLLSRRRSSILSFSSLDDTRHSAGNFIRPGLGLDDDVAIHLEEPSHWHSSPLAFAFLPALAGLFFTNGSAFVTDVLLLGLAALFLNWSVRLPWDWYRSAQAVVPLPRSRRSSTTLEEVDEAQQSTDSSDVQSRKGDPSGAEKLSASVQDDLERDDAAAQLRHHETLALLSTFALPAFAAYLLHVIRGQLSRPSNGLVSDYNLTIFLLAAEIRPVRQLIRLITNRTLHLQRVAAVGGEHASSSGNSKMMGDLISRLSELENKLSSHGLSPGVTVAQKEEVVNLSGELRKRYEPRLEALERAVRRYEKRATTLTLLTEQRLQSLESRLQDALSLAAVAAQSHNKAGVVATLLSALSKLMMLPLEALWFMVVWPIKVMEASVRRVGELVLGPPRRVTHRSSSRQPRSKMDKKKDDAYFGRNH